jgi:hypothetical protein
LSSIYLSKAFFRGFFLLFTKKRIVGKCNFLTAEKRLKQLDFKRVLSTKVYKSLAGFVLQKPSFYSRLVMIFIIAVILVPELLSLIFANIKTRR